MSLYFTIPFLFLLAIFQATAAPQIRIAGGSLNLLLLSVMSWEQIEARGDGYTWAFIGGLALDLLGGGPFGASILGLLAATFIANRLSSGLFRDRLFLPLVTAVAGTFAYNGIYLLMLQIFGVPIDLGGRDHAGDSAVGGAEHAGESDCGALDAGAAPPGETGRRDMVIG